MPEAKGMLDQLSGDGLYRAVKDKYDNKVNQLNVLLSSIMQGEIESPNGISAHDFLLDQLEPFSDRFLFGFSVSEQEKFMRLGYSDRDIWSMFTMIRMKEYPVFDALIGVDYMMREIKRIVFGEEYIQETSFFTPQGQLEWDESVREKYKDQTMKEMLSGVIKEEFQRVRYSGWISSNEVSKNLLEFEGNLTTLVNKLG